MSKLFNPITIRNINLKNRIVMSPLSLLEATDGFANEKHFNHYGQYAQEGVAAIIQEATSVCSFGRASDADLGIWKDEHIDYLKEIVKSIERQNCIPGIQLTHAGQRAASQTKRRRHKNDWLATTASTTSVMHNYSHQNLDKKTITEIIEKFKHAAERAIKAGYKIIEIHATHNYLIHQFLSPVVNKRTDEYGGSFTNRVRFLLDIISEIKPLLNEEHLLWVRLSATEWEDKGWTLNDSIALAGLLKDKGVDVLDLVASETIPFNKKSSYSDMPMLFAEAIRKDTGIIVALAGAVSGSHRAENVLKREQADLIMLGMPLIKQPSFISRASNELHQ